VAYFFIYLTVFIYLTAIFAGQQSPTLAMHQGDAPLPISGVNVTRTGLSDPFSSTPLISKRERRRQ